MQMLSVALLILMFLPIVISLAFMPYLTRETVSFGVSVSEDNFRSEPLRRMRRAYAMISLGIYGVLFILSLISIQSDTALEQNSLLAVYISLMVAASILLNLIFHFKMKKLRPLLPSAPEAKSVIAVDTRFRRNKLTVSNYWFLVHAAVILVNIVFVLMNYDRFPDTIAMQFDFQGNIIRSAAKSYRAVLIPNITQVQITLLFLFINWTILKSKQQTYAGDVERSVRQNTLFRRRWSLFIILSGLALIFMLSFVQLNMLYPQNMQAFLMICIAIPVFIVVFAMILSFTTGQGGSRIGRAAGGSKVQPVNDDAHWKFGFVYFNPQDPSVFVEKRMGIGWTINFANPVGWITLTVVIVAIVFVSLIT